MTAALPAPELGVSSSLAEDCLDARYPDLAPNPISQVASVSTLTSSGRPLRVVKQVKPAPLAESCQS